MQQTQEKEGTNLTATRASVAEQLRQNEMARKVKKYIKNVSSSEIGINDEFRQYYCAFCKAFVMIVNGDITEFSIRNIDRAITLNEDIYNANYLFEDKNGFRIILKRKNDILEKQIRYNCKNCGLLVAYRLDDSSHNLYIIHDALSETNFSENIESQTNNDEISEI